MQDMLKQNLFQNCISWRLLWNKNSIFTLGLIMLNASHSTASGYSLNNVLAEGCSNIHILVEILKTHKVVRQTGMRKIYKAVKLQGEKWSIQKCLWGEDLY